MPKIGGNPETANIIANLGATDSIEYGKNPQLLLFFSGNFRTSFDDSQKEAHPEMFAEFLGLDEGYTWSLLVLLAA